MSKDTLITVATSIGAIRVGLHTLNSEITSSYFFNTGTFNTGKLLLSLAREYADVIERNNIAFDMLYGPAYKAIPLIAAISLVMYNRNGVEIPYTFNRKEKKFHGDHGELVGANISGRVLIIDDVFTSGKSLLQSIKMVEHHGGTPVGCVVALDRQEMVEDTFASTLFSIQYRIPIYSIITYDDISSFLEIT
jgi:orotate phosphoribosyltransferase